MGSRRALMLSAFLASGLTLVLAGAPRVITLRGWAPLTTLAGEGDPGLAVERLTSAADTLNAALTGLDIDAPTQAFIDSVRASLASFDLEGFYETLPEQGDGPWRRLRVQGRRSGDAYLVRRVPAGQSSLVSPQGPLGDAAGELGGLILARPVAGPDGDPNYLLRAEVGLGTGPLGWEELMAGLEEAARLAASGDPRAPAGRSPRAARPDPQTRLDILATHPQLRPEDIEVLGVLWEAFPALCEQVLGLARTEDLLVFDPKGDGSYQQLRLSARLVPELMEERYPELAEFLAEMGPLLHANLLWRDEAGRQLARASVDTEAMRLTLEAFVADGRLLPVADGRVVLEPVTPAATRRARAEVSLRSQVNGIESRVEGLVVDCRYERLPEGADLVLRIDQAPRVSVGGRAFGLVPTWAIDVVIPGNLDELIRQFLHTACAGNEGRGIVGVIRARRSENGRAATFSVGGGLEVYDSTLVSFAMQIASQKLLPDSEVRSELRRLLVALHGAFVSDLGRFAQLQAVAPQTR